MMAEVVTENGPKDIFELLSVAGPHKHCRTCFSFTRCTADDDSCDFTECCCGAVMHLCKVDQHADVCPCQEVPCLNVEYGCNRAMPRNRLSNHLLNCPANVIVCKAEWNRWPLYTIERRRHIPFRQANPRAREGQLDYELAKRDQRMLDSLKLIPRRTKLCLRNYLTRRFPAVPVPAEILKRTYETEKNGSVVGLELDGKDDEDESDYIDVGNDLTYIGAKKKSQMNEQLQRWQDDLDARLKGKKIPPRYWEFPDLEKGNIHKHCAYCYTVDCKKENDFFSSYDEVACNIIECRQDCGAKFHNCKSSEHLIICPNYELLDEYEWMFRGMNSGRERMEAKKKKQLDKETRALYMYLEKSWPDQPKSPSKTSVTKAKKLAVPTPPPLPSNLYVVCPLDIRLDTVTRLQTKPRSMYTFVCAQEFKRKDYGWHYKNIHSDIHGGLNNWIEHRCPLAVYGCGFSSRRMFPHNSSQTLLYSPTVESFGVGNIPTTPKKTTTSSKSGDASSKKKTSTEKPTTAKKSAPSKSTKKSLTDLPLEILEKIFVQLDSFSLCNLAVTCRYFREICCDMLDARGCVALQWERVKLPGGKFHWQIAYKRWFFSPAIDPIEKWAFNPDEGAVSEHLKVCPFNIRTCHNPMPKDHKIWPEVLSALKSKMAERKAASK